MDEALKVESFCGCGSVMLMYHVILNIRLNGTFVEANVWEANHFFEFIWLYCACFVLFERGG